MRLREVKEEIEDCVDCPAETGTILDEIGNEVLEAPGGESERLAQVLTRDSTQTYSSTAELYASILCNLSEAYVGRKNYDDRGPALVEKQVSF